MVRCNFFIIIAVALLISVTTANAQYTQKWATDSATCIFDVGNTDADAQPEILCGSIFPNTSILRGLSLVDGLTGQVEWTYTNVVFSGTGIGGSNSNVIYGWPAGPRLEDIDNDGVDEIIFYDNDLQKLVCFDSDVSLGVLDEQGDNLLPNNFDLAQNFPNPFNLGTTIEYTIQRKSHVTLTVYNLLGQVVQILVDEEKAPGEYSVAWQGDTDKGKELASGLYFYTLKTEEEVDSKKMILLK